MKAHVINLPHRTDRRDAMEEQCRRLGIEPIFFEATNGKVAFPDEPRKLMRGHFGCLDSHKRLLESLYDPKGMSIERDGVEIVHLILEDDAVLADDWLEHAYIGSMEKRGLPSNFDILFLGGNITQMENAIEPFNDNFNVARNVLCTHAYKIKNHSIPRLLEVLNSRMWKVDILFTEFQKVANCYITKQCLAWQAVSHSDITDQVLDGTKLKY